MDKKKWILEEVYNLLRYKNFMRKIRIGTKWEMLKEESIIIWNYWKPWNVLNYVRGYIPKRKKIKMSKVITNKLKIW